MLHFRQFSASSTSAFSIVNFVDHFVNGKAQFAESLFLTQLSNAIECFFLIVAVSQILKTLEIIDIYYYDVYSLADRCLLDLLCL